MRFPLDERIDPELGWPDLRRRWRRQTTRVRAVLLAACCAMVVAATPGVAQDAAEHLPPSPDLSALEPGLYAVLDTQFGVITARLFDQLSPLTVQNFVALSAGRRPWLDPKSGEMVQSRFYDGLTFHRVIPHFMVQTGDPTGVGDHDCGFLIPGEIRSDLLFDRPGRLGMATFGGDPNTGSCQFFITETADSTLDGKHAIFGQVIDGLDVVSKLSRVLVDQYDKPRSPIRLYSVQVVRKVPPAEPVAEPTGDAESQ